MDYHGSPGYVGADITFVIGGFDDGEPYGKVFTFRYPVETDPDRTNPGDFGITWGGQREIVDRLIQGYDSRLIGIASQVLALTQVQVASLAQVSQPVLHLIYALRNGPGESGSAVDHLVTPETLG
jgi:hypothetical protein